LVFSFWIPPCAGIIETLGCDLREIMINFCNAWETVRLYGSDRRRGQSAERLPYHVSGIRHSAKDAVHELQWLLI
jgi:hypothetical protein